MVAGLGLLMTRALSPGRKLGQGATLVKSSYGVLPAEVRGRKEWRRARDSNPKGREARWISSSPNDGDYRPLSATIGNYFRVFLHVCSVFVTIGTLWQPIVLAQF